MATLRADRRLYVTADREKIVEEGDPDAAWLLAGVGRQIGEPEVAKYRLQMKDGRVTWPELEADAPEAESKMVEAGEDKAEDAPEWTLSTAPEDYLDRYGEDAPNSDLARAVIAAAEG